MIAPAFLPAVPTSAFWNLFVAGQAATAGWACGFVTYYVGDKRMWAIDATRGRCHVVIHSDDIHAGFLELKAQTDAITPDF